MRFAYQEREEWLQIIADCKDRIIAGFVEDARCRLIALLKRKNYSPADLIPEIERAVNWIEPLHQKYHAVSALDGILRRESCK